jgi:hypothetical protein
MKECLDIDDRKIEEYRQLLETLIPQQIDGIDTEIGTMVRFAYIPQSLNLKYLEAIPDSDPLTPYYSAWTYAIHRMEMRGTSFVPTQKLEGFVVILISADGSLITANVDFLTGLLSIPESDYQLDESCC